MRGGKRFEVAPLLEGAAWLEGVHLAVDEGLAVRQSMTWMEGVARPVALGVNPSVHKVAKVFKLPAGKAIPAVLILEEGRSSGEAKVNSKVDKGTRRAFEEVSKPEGGDQDSSTMTCPRSCKQSAKRPH